MVTNRPFRLGLGIYVFTWIAVDLVQAVILYFLKYCVRREAQGDLIMGSIFVSAIVSLPLWNLAGPALGQARRLYRRGCPSGPRCSWSSSPWGPPRRWRLLFVLCVLAGIGVGAAHVLPWSILPDAIEYNEYTTGVRQEGTFYSVVTLAQKVASSVAIPLCLLLLQASGYRPNLAEQPLSASLAIRLAMGVLPGLLLGLGTLCAARYPLRRKEYRRDHRIPGAEEASRAGARRVSRRAAIRRGASPVRAGDPGALLAGAPEVPHLPLAGLCRRPACGCRPCCRTGPASCARRRGPRGLPGPPRRPGRGHDRRARGPQRGRRGPGTRDARFGFFECVEDLEAARALLDRAAAWARERGLERLAGPYNLDAEDSHGVLIEGRDRPPALLCGHSPAYYPEYLERCGFTPHYGDGLAFEVRLDQDSPAIRQCVRLAERIRRRGLDHPAHPGPATPGRPRWTWS